MAFEVFHRTWWKPNPDWPDGREPAPGKRYPITTVQTEQEAIEICRKWNQSHNPGWLSDIAEYSES